ncbi:HK97 family phage prohead protease [Pulveribacter suum]|uniref:HK97 family phage prohead protease n=1 Tax=Pulveribacter suum TaxID=2116657 RepID=A0A2P1NJD7_9BURK|nr:HK97 family phage prohead protease [Pulveribacter suum]AVP57100.1 HK97 family phage prohead protease [Pulveribacter suum]
MLEVRSTHGLASNGRTLSGHAAVFNSEANLGQFSEVIRQGAFRDTLESGANVRALYHHDGSALLGTTRGGTLKLREDAKGLAFELALPDTTHGRDLAILVDRGDVAGCSFGFRVKEGGDRWEYRGSTLVRELLAVDLVEVTLTSDPAYADTTVALRSMKEAADSLGMDAFLRDPIMTGEYRQRPGVNFLWLELCR